MILYNAIRTPDGTTIESKHVHDFVQHKDKKTGKVYAVDGGHQYLRRSGTDDYEELSIQWTPEMPHEVLRDYMKWGSRGKDGKSRVAYVTLKDMDTDHINAILDTQDLYAQHNGAFYAKAFLAELNYRKEELK